MRYVLIFIVCFWSASACAAEVTIEMLNKQGSESMVFSKKIVKINVGDKIFWKAIDPTHNVEFVKNGVPKGVEKFKSKINEDTEYLFTVPGIYAYWCTPHKSLGMIAFVFVNDDKSNLEEIKKIRFFGKSRKVAKLLIEQI